MNTTVRFSRKNSVDSFEINHPALEKIIADYSGLTPEAAGGLPKALLGASALACYAATLEAALKARHIQFDNLKGEAEIETGPNSMGQGRVMAVKLKFSLTVSEKDREAFARVDRIMRSGCLVTASLQDGMTLAYELDANFSA